MQTNQESQSALERRIDMSVPMATIEQEVAVRLKRLARSVKMPGFRPGKVPMKLGKTASPAEQVTISIDDTPAGGTLRIEWGSKSATAPFTVG